MTADVLLSCLEGVKCTGPYRWIARCPAHDDRKASLAIRELDDGRVLVHDFAGCDIEFVLSAIGLKFSDLYPETGGDYHKPERRPFPAADVLRCIAFEALVVSCAAAAMAKGQALPEVDRKRMTLAAARISAAVLESGHE